MTTDSQSYSSLDEREARVFREFVTALYSWDVVGNRCAFLPQNCTTKERFTLNFLCRWKWINAHSFAIVRYGTGLPHSQTERRHLFNMWNNITWRIIPPWLWGLRPAFDSKSDLIVRPNPNRSGEGVAPASSAEVQIQTQSASPWLINSRRHSPPSTGPNTTRKHKPLTTVSQPVSGAFKLTQHHHPCLRRLDRRFSFFVDLKHATSKTSTQQHLQTYRLPQGKDNGLNFQPKKKKVSSDEAESLGKQPHRTLDFFLEFLIVCTIYYIFINRTSAEPG